MSDSESESSSDSDSPPPKKTKNVKSQKKGNSDVHKCDRIPRGKTEPCGKNAKNKVKSDGTHWYCGTEKSGCYKAIMNAVNKSNTKSAPKGKSKAPAPKTNAGRKSSSDVKSKTLVDKLSKKSVINPRKIKIGKETHYVDSETRILFDKVTKEAYGELSKDKKSVVPLSKKNIKFVEANGLKIREEKQSKKKANLKKKISKKMESSDSDSSDSEVENIKKELANTSASSGSDSDSDSSSAGISADSSDDSDSD